MANKQFIVKHGMDVKRTDGTSSLSIAADTGALTMGQALNTTSTIESGAKLTVAAGGADINGMLDAKGGLNVTGGDVVVTGNLTVNGTTTTVNSNTVTIDDPVFTLGGDAAPNSVSTKDRGIEFRWHDGSNPKMGFMGRSNASGKFLFISDASVSNDTYSGTAATLVGALEGNADTATNFNSDRTLTITADDINGTSSTSATGNHSVSLTIGANKVTFAKFQTLSDLKVVGNVSGATANAAEISIDTDMAGGVSGSHDSLASAKTIKEYVDAQLSSANSIAEMTDTDISGIDQAHVLVYDKDDDEWQNQVLTGDVTMTKDGVTAIGAQKVTDAMIQNGGLANASLTNSTVAFGGVSLALGAADTTPAFNLEDATGYPTSSLVGTITNAQLAGSIANDKLAGSIANDKLANSTVAFGGVSLALGGTDATPAFNLSDATAYPTSSLVGTITNNQLAGSIASTKIAELNNFSTDDLAEIAGTEAEKLASGKAYFSVARGRAAIPAPTVTNPDSMGNFEYNSTSGVMTYTAPTNAETVAQFDASADDGFNLSNAGVITLDQSIKTGATPTFAGLTITGNLVTNGTTTTVNATQMDIQDPVMRLASNNGADSRDIGLVGKYNDGADKHTALFRDASDGKWKLITESTQADISTANEIVAANGTKGTLVANLEGNVVGDVTGDVTGNADTATALAATRTFAITGGGITAAAQDFNGSQNVSLSASIDANAVTLAKMAQLADMKVIGNVSGGTADPAAVSILDEDDLSSDSATALATQQSIKAYVDSEITAAGSMAALSDTTVAAAADAHIMVYDNATSKWENQVMAGDVTMSKDGATTIGATKVTNAMLAGSIENGKLQNSTVAFGGVSLSLGGTDTTPAFDLQDATNLPTTSLTGTITNAQLAGSISNDKLAGSIANDKLANSTVAFGGVSLSLGGSDTSPAFDLSDATDYPTSSLVGTITNAQLAGSIANDKLANSTVSGKALGTNLDALTSASNALTMSGDYNGSAARTVTLSLHDNDALEVGASGLDLKDTIAGARTFSEQVTASAGVDMGQAAMATATYTASDANAGTADSFAKGTFRSAKYVVQVTSGTDYQCSELLVIHDGVTASVAEYGLMHTSASALMTFDVDIDGADVRLRATGSANDVVKLTRSCIKL